MTDNFFLALATILLLPLIPAYIIYKFLPAGKVADTDISGPYTGLSLKLKGAFAGYFLLVIVGLTLQYSIMNSGQKKKIEDLGKELVEKDKAIKNLDAQVAASSSPVIDWHVKGVVQPGKTDTRFFYDDGTTSNNPDGSFELIKRCIATQGTAKPPKWICVYNSATGFNVISLNREVNHPDINKYDVSFNDNEHEILIKKAIDINSKEKDSTIAVANFFDLRPELKAKVLQTDPKLFDKANSFKKQMLSTQLVNPSH